MAMKFTCMRSGRESPLQLQLTAKKTSRSVRKGVRTAFFKQSSHEQVSPFPSNLLQKAPLLNVGGRERTAYCYVRAILHPQDEFRYFFGRMSQAGTHNDDYIIIRSSNPIQCGC
jgi:hypothetical protein